MFSILTIVPMLGTQDAQSAADESEQSKRRTLKSVSLHPFVYIYHRRPLLTITINPIGHSDL